MAIDVKACVGEFLAMMFFVFISCGTPAVLLQSGREEVVPLQASLTFGLAITTLAYTFGHRSGAQINCAVTFALALNGTLAPVQACANFASQMLGAVLGGVFYATVSTEAWSASNVVFPGHSRGEALLGEIICTALLCLVVFETAVNPATEATRGFAPIPIGFAVFLAHCVLIPIDNCSINPTRSFGTAIADSMFAKDVVDAKNDNWGDHWVFWIGPLIGAAVGWGMYVVQNKIAEATATEEKA